jgi:hypothetical protein
MAAFAAGLTDGVAAGALEFGADFDQGTAAGGAGWLRGLSIRFFVGAMGGSIFAIRGHWESAFCKVAPLFSEALPAAPTVQ